MGFSIGNILGFGQKKKTQHDYGKKDTSFWGKGVKWVSDHAGEVEDVAEEVGDIAGMVSTGAAVAAPLLLASGVGAPLAGAVAGIGAAAKGVQGVAGTVEGTAKTARAASNVARGADVALQDLRRGDIRGAVEAGSFAAQQAQDLRRKGIQRKKK